MASSTALDGDSDSGSDNVTSAISKVLYLIEDFRDAIQPAGKCLTIVQKETKPQEHYSDEDDFYLYDNQFDSHEYSFYHGDEKDSEYDILAENFENKFYDQFNGPKCRTLKNKRSKKVRTNKAKYTKKPTDDTRKNKRKARTEFHRRYISPVADASSFLSPFREAEDVTKMRDMIKDFVICCITMNLKTDQQKCKIVKQIARLLTSVEKHLRRERFDIFVKEFGRLQSAMTKKHPRVAECSKNMIENLNYLWKQSLNHGRDVYGGFRPWIYENVYAGIVYNIDEIMYLLKKITSCALCCDDSKDLQLIKNGCYEGCHMCLDCVKGFLKSSADRGKVKLRCPGMGCGCDIPEPEKIFGKIAPEEWKHFKESIWKNKLKICKNFRFCPNESCGAGFQMPSRCCFVKSVACPECDYTFCPQCYGPDHSEIGTCLEFLALCQGKDTTQVTNENTKQCPFCLVWIEKNDGCSHMTCDHCHGEFCWRCMGDWHLHGYNDCPKWTKFTVERPTFEQLIPSKPLGYYKLNRDACIRLQARLKSWKVNVLPKDAIVKVVAFRGNRVQIQYSYTSQNVKGHWCSLKTVSGTLLEFCKEQAEAKKQYDSNIELDRYHAYYRDPNHPPAHMRLFEEEQFRDAARILVVNYDPWNDDDMPYCFSRMEVKWCFTDEPKLAKPEFEELLEDFEAKKMKKKERGNLSFRHNYNKAGIKNKLSSKNKNCALPLVSSSRKNDKKKQNRRRKVNHFRNHRSQQQQLKSVMTSLNAKIFEQKRRARKQSCRRSEINTSLLEETSDMMFVYV